MGQKDKTDQERADFCRQMLAGPVSEANKKQLEFGLAYYGPLDKAGKLKFLLQTQDNFQYLFEWEPDHSWLQLRAFCSKDADFTTAMPLAQLHSMAVLLGEHPDLLTSIGHPVLKALTRDLLSLTKIAGSSDMLQALVKQVFFELCALRLGIRLEDTAMELPADENTAPCFFVCTTVLRTEPLPILKKQLSKSFLFNKPFCTIIIA